MQRWVIPTCSWVGFLVLLCSVQTRLWAQDEEHTATPAKDAEHSEAADEEHGDAPDNETGEHTEEAGHSEEDGDSADAGHVEDATQSEDAHAQAGGRGGAHHDPYDLGHQNGTKMLEDPSEFKSDLAIWTFVVFLCLLLLLLKFAWGPVMDGLDKREQSIAAMIDEAKASADKAAEQLRQYEARLEAAGDEAREVLAQAQRQAESVKDDIVAEARTAAQRERERAVADIELATKAALQEITTRGVDLAVTMAGQILRRQLAPEDQAKLIREALDQLPSRN